MLRCLIVVLFVGCSFVQLVFLRFMSRIQRVAPRCDAWVRLWPGSAMLRIVLRIDGIDSCGIFSALYMYLARYLSILLATAQHMMWRAVSSPFRACQLSKGRDSQDARPGAVTGRRRYGKRQVMVPLAAAALLLPSSHACTRWAGRYRRLPLFEFLLIAPLRKHVPSELVLPCSLILLCHFIDRGSSSQQLRRVSVHVSGNAVATQPASATAQLTDTTPLHSHRRK